MRLKVDPDGSGLVMPGCSGHSGGAGTPARPVRIDRDHAASRSRMMQAYIASDLTLGDEHTTIV
jgi:hypothetical protein